MSSVRNTNVATNSSKKPTVIAVRGKEESTVTKQVAVTSRRTTGTKELDVKKPVVKREIKNDIPDKYTYAHRALRGSPSGVVEGSFKNKKSGETISIEMMPLGYEGFKTRWNPDGLNPKDLLKKRYSEGSENSFSEVFGYFYTPHAPLSLEGAELPRKIFTVNKGFDIAVGVAVFNTDEDDSISRSAFLPYVKLAPKLDAISERMVKSGQQEVVARARVAGDILRVERGAVIKGSYTAEEWHHLAEFAMVIRADKARAPKSTRYNIDKQVSSTSNSFVERFGSGCDSLYIGAPKGGAKSLKEDQANWADKFDATLTDPGSDKAPTAK